MVTALGYISYSWEVNKPQDCQTANEILFICLSLMPFQLHMLFLKLKKYNTT